MTQRGVVPGAGNGDREYQLHFVQRGVLEAKPEGLLIVEEKIQSAMIELFVEER